MKSLLSTLKKRRRTSKKEKKKKSENLPDDRAFEGHWKRLSRGKSEVKRKTNSVIVQQKALVTLKKKRIGNTVLYRRRERETTHRASLFLAEKRKEASE